MQYFYNQRSGLKNKHSNRTLVHSVDGVLLEAYIGPIATTDFHDSNFGSDGQVECIGEALPLVGFTTPVLQLSVPQNPHVCCAFLGPEEDTMP